MQYDSYAIETTDYYNAFWDKAMKGNTNFTGIINKGAVGNEMFVMPYDSDRKYMEALKGECVFRQIATSFKTNDSDLKIYVSDSEEPAEWAQNNPFESIKDVVDVFTKHEVLCHKLAVITRLDTDFIADNKINIKEHMVKHFAKRFGKAEEDAFINGTGVDMPTGILHDTKGAEVGSLAAELTYDSVIKLYFSVKRDYRSNGVWLMNDETALALRTLKDANGNYLWNHSNDTILGKKVYISNYMPSVASGNKVIAFGDFSYYWILNRMPMCVRSLTERYALHNQVGYLAHEYLDAKLIRPEAIKVLKIS